MKLKQLCKTLGIAVLAFGVGILVSFFLPEEVLVVAEALVIICGGFIYFQGR